MTVSPVSTTLQTYQNRTPQNNLQKFQQEFQQLGADLQSGNLSAAQGDVTALQQLGAPGSSSSSSSSPSSSSSSLSNPISQALNQLSEQLQSGNLSGAQQDYSNLQQNLQRPAHMHHHHGHHVSGTPSTPVDNELLQLGQSVQTSSQTSAQQAYSALQPELPPVAASPDASLSSPSLSSGGVSLTA